MKKIFTLLFTVGMFVAAMAQPGTRDNRPGERDKQIPVQQDDSRYDNDKSFISIDLSFGRDDHSGNSRFSNERKRDMQIARINREYDQRIQRVRNSYFMSRWEKQRQIRFLQEQRQQEIRMVYAKFSKRNQHNGWDNRNGGYDRNDRNDRQGRDY